MHSKPRNWHTNPPQPNENADVIAYFKTQPEYSWSLLDPRPVLKYIDFLDEYIVYWDGIAMTHLAALNIAMTSLNVFPTPAMKARIFGNYKRIYYSGGFGIRNDTWDRIISEGRVYNYLMNQMQPHLAKTIEKYTGAEILGWFDYKKARTKVNE